VIRRPGVTRSLPGSGMDSWALGLWKSIYICIFFPVEKKRGWAFSIVGPSYSFGPSHQSYDPPISAMISSTTARVGRTLLNKAMASSRRIATTTLGAGRTSPEHTRYHSKTPKDQSRPLKILKERSQKEIPRTEQPQPKTPQKNGTNKSVWATSATVGAGATRSHTSNE